MIDVAGSCVRMVDIAFNVVLCLYAPRPAKYPQAKVWKGPKTSDIFFLPQPADPRSSAGSSAADRHSGSPPTGRYRTGIPLQVRYGIPRVRTSACAAGTAAGPLQAHLPLSDH